MPFARYFCIFINVGLGEGAPTIGVPFFWPSAAMPNTVIDSWSGMVFLKFNGAKFSASDYPVLAKVFPSLVLPEARGDFIGLGEGANWVMLPGGMTIQRVYLGFPVGTNVRHITFPRSFTTTNYSISINWNDIGTVTTETQSPANVAVVHQTKSLTGASIWQAGPGGFNVDIIAVGY